MRADFHLMQEFRRHTLVSPADRFQQIKNLLSDFADPKIREVRRKIKKYLQLIKLIVESKIKWMEHNYCTNASQDNSANSSSRSSTNEERREGRKCTIFKWYTNLLWYLYFYNYLFPAEWGDFHRARMHFYTVGPGIGKWCIIHPADDVKNISYDTATTLVEVARGVGVTMAYLLF